MSFLRHSLIAACLLPMTALAQTSGATAQSYFDFDACRAILSLQESIAYESTMAGKIQNREQAYQLLLDHEVLFGDGYAIAMGQWLGESGIHTGLSPKQVAEKMKTLTELSDSERMTAARKILTYFPSSNASGRRLAEAMSELADSHPLLQAFDEYTKAALRVNYAESLAGESEWRQERNARRGRTQERNQKQQLLMAKVGIASLLPIMGTSLTLYHDWVFTHFTGALITWVSIPMTPVLYLHYLNLWRTKRWNNRQARINEARFDAKFTVTDTRSRAWELTPTWNRNGVVIGSTNPPPPLEGDLVDLNPAQIQFLLASEVQDWLRQFEAQGSIQELETKLIAMEEQVQALRKIPYEFDKNRPHAESVPLGALLLTRIDQLELGLGELRALLETRKK